MTRRSQLGLSLISLMVALTIGLFLLAGLFDIWFQTRRSFNAQGSLSQLQDNERLAMTLITNSVQSGGFYPIADNYATSPPNPLLTTNNVFTIATPFKVNGQYVSGTHSASGGSSDTLIVRFMSDGNGYDCQGQQQPDQTEVTNTFSVNGTNLQCTVGTNSYANTTVTTDAAQNLVAGVSNFTVWYGVDPTATGSVTQYMTADTVTTDNYWAYVRSVKLTLSFVNPLADGTKGQPTALPAISRVVSYNQGTSL